MLKRLLAINQKDSSPNEAEIKPATTQASSSNNIIPSSHGMTEEDMDKVFIQGAVEAKLKQSASDTNELDDLFGDLPNSKTTTSKKPQAPDIFDQAFDNVALPFTSSTDSTHKLNHILRNATPKQTKVIPLNESEEYGKTLSDIFSDVYSQPLPSPSKKSEEKEEVLADGFSQIDSLQPLSFTESVEMPADSFVGNPPFHGDPRYFPEIPFNENFVEQILAGGEISDTFHQKDDVQDKRLQAEKQMGEPELKARNSFKLAFIATLRAYILLANEEIALAEKKRFGFILGVGKECSELKEGIALAQGWIDKYQAPKYDEQKTLKLTKLFPSLTNEKYRLLTLMLIRLHQAYNPANPFVDSMNKAIDEYLEKEKHCLNKNQISFKHPYAGAQFSASYPKMPGAKAKKTEWDFYEHIIKTLTNLCIAVQDLQDNPEKFGSEETTQKWKFYEDAIKKLTTLSNSVKNLENYPRMPDTNATKREWGIYEKAIKRFTSLNSESYPKMPDSGAILEEWELYEKAIEAFERDKLVEFLQEIDKQIPKFDDLDTERAYDLIATFTNPNTAAQIFNTYPQMPGTKASEEEWELYDQAVAVFENDRQAKFLYHLNNEAKNFLSSDEGINRAYNLISILFFATDRVAVKMIHNFVLRDFGSSKILRETLKIAFCNYFGFKDNKVVVNLHYLVESAVQAYLNEYKNNLTDKEKLVDVGYLRAQAVKLHCRKSEEELIKACVFTYVLNHDQGVKLRLALTKVLYIYFDVSQKTHDERMKGDGQHSPSELLVRVGLIKEKVESRATLVNVDKNGEPLARVYAESSIDLSHIKVEEKTKPGLPSSTSILDMADLWASIPIVPATVETNPSNTAVERENPFEIESPKTPRNA